LRDCQFGFREDSLVLRGHAAFVTFFTTLELPRHDPGRLGAKRRFPALSGIPGQFLIKDLVLLGISLWSLDEAWERAREAGRPPDCSPS
jgi:uncharacterized membrane protein YkgB